MATRKLAADYPDERARAHYEWFERAIAASSGEGDAVEPRLRGLAPGLRLETLLERP
jgi:hypothetical protein